MMACFPVACGGCNQPLSHQPQYLLCPLCSGAIADNPEPSKAKIPSGVRSYAPYLYGGPLENMITAAKFRGRIDLTRALAELLMAAPRTKSLLKRSDLLVPMPLSAIRHFQRGYNQSHEIAKALGQFGHIPVHRGWRRRHRRPQHLLGRQERLTNLRDAFKAPKGVENKRVLLVDDIVTTGATLAEASKVLLASGAQKVRAIAVAEANWSYLKT